MLKIQIRSTIFGHTRAGVIELIFKVKILKTYQLRTHLHLKSPFKCYMFCLFLTLKCDTHKKSLFDAFANSITLASLSTSHGLVQTAVVDFIGSITGILRTAKTLTSLRLCIGWYESLMFACALTHQAHFRKVSVVFVGMSCHLFQAYHEFSSTCYVPYFNKRQRITSLFFFSFKQTSRTQTVRNPLTYRKLTEHQKKL